MLRVENLQKNFNVKILGDKHIPGCHDISFQLKAGQFVSLSGPSGAGKSTILKCIYRTYLPGSGHIWYDSANYGVVDLATVSERILLDIRNREMAYVSQFLNVIPRVSALDLVMEPILTRNGVSYQEARERACHLLQRLQIPEELFEAYPATFSGGEQQRVNIARAVSWKPRLLLLDEPTASLDVKSIDRVLELLTELRQQGTTMVGIFHDPEIMKKTASHIYPLQ
ncbi:alpha-D-ribose 1-methylphosphonate 5-triphosphate synthase subunit PhnL [Desulfuromusa kysingii]|uniref:Alpha-D-ribose 1-methylphosphonate 5-triphosphate synthase subunit PhnL n=1 Tax=Desulfuromusa kysingii TaxID=37625 RepID=A0A1H3ZWH8_9BACT|nr:phosphonate C-P lyase system protein PhnL [Desulfuromusa kysingii]SEA28020.1 alpha-D-ribose 1-methylphosphonate 5-triphosphate synthase subunit PhnL [Desulfuromusa kysingii]